MKQSELSKWLLGILTAVGVFAAGGVFVLAPIMGRNIAQAYPEFAFMYWPSLIYIWLSSLPLFISLVLAWKIFIEIGHDNSFCEENAARLKYIGKLALFDAIFFALGAITLVIMNMAWIWMLIMFAFCIVLSLGGAVVMAALSHLTYKAYLLKQDSDLTI